MRQPVVAEGCTAVKPRESRVFSDAAEFEFVADGSQNVRNVW